jgi:hypothetical protein
MTYFIILSMFTLFSVPSFAATEAGLPALPQKGVVNPLDRYQFCYFNNSVFSEGAETNGLVCYRPDNVMTYQGVETAPLRWKKINNTLSNIQPIK